MKLDRHLIATMVATALFAADASAAADAWNEAVSIDKNGKRTVELPPKVGKWPDTPPAKWEPPIPGNSYVLEGPDGLIECAQPYFRAGKFCNSYRPGMYAQPRKRVWVVKRKADWLLCSELKATSDCIGLRTNKYEPFKAQL
jgi:hypothetical protein